MHSVLNGLSHISNENLELAEGLKSAEKLEDKEHLAMDALKGLKKIGHEADQIAADIKRKAPKKGKKSAKKAKAAKKAPKAKKAAKPVHEDLAELTGAHVLHPYTDESGSLHLVEMPLGLVKGLVSKVKQLTGQGTAMQVLDVGHSMMVPITDDKGQAQLVFLPKSTHKLE